MTTRGPEPEMKDDQIIRVLENGDRPFATASEVADVGGISRQNAHRRLQRLYESDKIEKYKAGSSAVIWWVKN